MYSNHQSAHLSAAQLQATQQITQVLQSTPLKKGKHKNKFSFFLLVCVLLPLPHLTGCSLLPKTEAEAQSSPPGGERGGGSTPVDVAIARTAILQEATSYTGTSRPFREVLLRAQVEGRLLNLNVGAGDLVKQGQILAQLDDALLVTSVSQEQAELAALEAEVARAETQVSNARARAEQARVELNQARIDAARRATLGSQGAISQQEAELAQTAARTAEQTLLSALEQIRTEQKAVAAATSRVEAQRAAVAQAGERRSYTMIASPINGVVLEQLSESGNLVQPGGEILKLGDFSQVKVVVSVSELELSKIRLGQSVQVTLDAFPNEPFTGRVVRISPSADPTARQLPVEIAIPNTKGQIGSGLLARVSFESTTTPRVVVPQTALQEEAEQGNTGVGEQESSLRTQKQQSNPKSKIQNPTRGRCLLLRVKGNKPKCKLVACKWASAPMLK